MTEKERPATRTGLERGSGSSNGSRRGSSGGNDSRSFVVRWRDVVCVHPELSSTGTLVLYTLSLWMSASGLGRPSATTISKGCKFNKSTGRDIVGRELKEAVRLGLLEATPAEGRPTTYQAVIPACFQGVGREALNLPALSRDLPALEGVPAPREQARNSSEVETTNRKDLRAEVEEIEELTTPTNPSSMPGLDLISEESEATNLSGGESINTLKNEPPPFRRLRVIYGHKTVEVSYPDQDSDEFIGYLQSLGASCLVSTLPNGRIALHSTAAPIVELAA